MKRQRFPMLLFTILSPLPPASGQTRPPGDLTDATLEELMNVQVTSVSKTKQSLSKTAASVYVITAEDIRRSGFNSVPETLRLSPGVQVARSNSGTWAISIRGFNDEFANKLLVLVDGRSAYSQLDSGVSWDIQQMPMDNIERIEVIRGPGAVMWGINAVNGVINIITKAAQATQGGVITAEGGNGNEMGGNARYGGRLGSNAYYRIDARDDSRGAFNSPGGLPGAPNGWTNGGADFRVDWNPTAQDSVLFSGEAYRSVVGHEYPVPLPGNPFPALFDAKIDRTGGNFLARWQHEFSGGSSASGQVSWESADSADVQTPVNESILNVDFQQHVVAGGRQELIWGVDFRESIYRFGDIPSNLTPVLNSALRLPDFNESLSDVFAEDQITLVPDKLQIIAGVHVSHNGFTGFEVQPTGRLLWTPNNQLATWVSVSRAVRTPSVYERSFDAIVSETPIAPPLFALAHLLGNPDFRSETMVAYEAGQRVQIGRRISLDGSLFYNVYQHLASVLAETPVFMPAGTLLPPYLEIPTVFGNTRYGESYGGELNATWSLNDRWKLTGGSSTVLIHTRSYPGIASNDSLRTEGASPKHEFQVHSYFNLTRKIQLDTGIYYYGAMPVLGVPRHVRGDVRLGWRPTDKLEFSAGVQDAFDANHVEFLSSRFPQLEVVPRTVYGKVTWRF